jgi:hypothetical protein
MSIRLDTDELPTEQELGAGDLGLLGERTDEDRALDDEVRPPECYRGNPPICAQLESLDPIDHGLFAQVAQDVGHVARDDERPRRRVDSAGALEDLNLPAATGQEEGGKEPRCRPANDRDIRSYASIRS